MKTALLLASLLTVTSCSGSCCGSRIAPGPTSVDAGPVPPADAGPVAPSDAGPCVYAQSRDGCGCCFHGESIQCPPGVVGAPDAGPVTLPLCN